MSEKIGLIIADIYHYYPLLHIHSTVETLHESGAKIETEHGLETF